jgi:hypothetical protein
MPAKLDAGTRRVNESRSGLAIADYGFRLASRLEQRKQLNQTLLTQAENAGSLAQAQ